MDRARNPMSRTAARPRVLASLYLVLMLVGALLSAGPAIAREGCLVPVEITEARVADAGEYGFDGFAGEGALPAFVTGWLSPTRPADDAGDLFGSVVFVRGPGNAWRAFQPKPGEGVVAVFAAAEAGALALLTMWQTEGPGQSWTFLKSEDGFATGDCVEIDFPKTLNQPFWANEFLSLLDFDIAADGTGEITGVAHTEDLGSLWYRYATRDGGRTWAPPQALAAPREVAPGRYREIARGPAPADLVADLERFAAGR